MPMAPDGQEWADAIVCTGTADYVFELVRYSDGGASNNQILYRLISTGDHYVNYNKTTGARGTTAGEGASCPASYADAKKAHYGGGSGGDNSGPLLPATAMPDVIACPYSSTPICIVYYYKSFNQTASPASTRYDNPNNGYVYYNNSTGGKGATTGSATTICPSNISAVTASYNFGDGSSGGGSSGDSSTPQQWQNVRSQRVVGTSYQNTTGQPIMVSISGAGEYGAIQVSHDGTTWVHVGSLGRINEYAVSNIFSVPAGHFYRQQNGVLAGVWAELR